MYQIYKVEASDTFENIAQKFGISIEKLREINGLGEIYAGGYILVPSQITGQQIDDSLQLYTSYIVKQGDNVYAIAREYGVPYETLLSINGLNKNDYIYPNQQLLIPKSDYAYYITADGDTLDEVINVFNSNKDKFLNENKTIYLMAGQLLVNKK